MEPNLAGNSSVNPQIARSSDNNIDQIGCVVSEIMKFHDFHISVHYRRSYSSIAVKFNRVLCGSQTFHLTLILWKSGRPSLRKVSESK